MSFLLAVLLSLNLFHVKYAIKEFSLARYKDTLVYANNSVIDINLVGEGFEGAQITDGGALECHTDDTTCCRGIDNPNGQGRGEWYYPDGTVVPPPGGRGGATGFYRTRDHMVIRLNRAVVVGPAGVYRCEIPGAEGVTITRYITLHSKECRDLLAITNGTIVYTPPRDVSAHLPVGRRYTGTIATYSCSPGYQLVGGSSLRACGPDVTWNGTEPFCGELSLTTSPSTTVSTTTQHISQSTTTPLTSTSSTTPSTQMSASSLTTQNGRATFTPTNKSIDQSATLYTDQEYSTIEGSTVDLNGMTNPSTAAIAGVIPGVLAIFLILLVVVIILFIIRKKQRKEQTYFINDDYEMSPVRTLSESAMTEAPILYGFPTHLFPTEGEGVHIEAKVEGHPPPTLVWYHDGEVVVTDYSIEIDEQGSLFFPSIELKHSGVYKLVASNECGEAEKVVTVSVMSEGCDGGEEINQPVPVAEFGAFVSEHHARGNKKFRESYERLPIGETGHEIIVSTTPENKLRNRFKNISVYDDNQVVLQPHFISCGKKYTNNYINASYVDGYSIKNKFIAAQGPLPNTLVDFWRMVWQEKPSAIVMLTNCEEGGRVKCEQYWPETNQSYGPFLVINTEQSVHADYTIRNFVVTNTVSKEQSFKVTQFHFTAWPDHGVPAYASPVLSFLRLIRSHHVPSSGPLIVHCSAGVGRTGTYITLDNVLDQIEADGLVDIDGVIVKMRNQRMKMVQTKNQYIFIHDAILEFLLCGDTQISSANLPVTINKLSEEDPTHQCTGFQHQFNVLDQMCPSPTDVNSFTALKYPDKNRGDKYLPVESSRVILKGEQPDYINAVFVDGYKHQKAYIIAQNPLETTVRNFWKVIVDRKCRVVVMLTPLEENGEESCARYWPTEGTACEEFGEFSVTKAEEESRKGFVVRKFIIESTKLVQSHQVTQFQVTNWSPDGTCSNLKVLTDVIEEVAKVQRKTGNNPILVHCSDTVSRSGMFCAIATTIDRCKTEGVVDVFQVVKALRIHKPGAVLNVDQYRLIHEAVLLYLKSFEVYANFKNVV